MSTVVIMRQLRLLGRNFGPTYDSTVPIGVLSHKRARFWIKRIEGRIRAFCREARVPSFDYVGLNHCPQCGGPSKIAQRTDHRICADRECRHVFSAADDPFHALNRAPLIELDDIFDNEQLVREMLIQNFWPRYHWHPVKELTL